MLFEFKEEENEPTKKKGYLAKIYISRNFHLIIIFQDNKYSAVNI